MHIGGLSRVAVFAGVALAMSPAAAVELNPPLAKYVSQRVGEFSQIPAERQALLRELAAYIRVQRDADAPVRITFICTHNSRRSHMAQLWAAVAAAQYGIEAETYSGGTQATAFHPNAVAALVRTGFDIRPTGTTGAPPTYSARFATDREPIESFSKAYSDESNPQEGFCAVMTCSQADEACPNVEGAACDWPLLMTTPKSRTVRRTRRRFTTSGAHRLLAKCCLCSPKRRRVGQCDAPRRLAVRQDAVRRSPLPRAPAAPFLPASRVSRVVARWRRPRRR